jgi:hypothetical protein
MKSLIPVQLDHPKQLRLQLIQIIETDMLILPVLPVKLTTSHMRRRGIQKQPLNTIQDITSNNLDTRVNILLLMAQHLSILNIHTHNINLLSNGIPNIRTLNSNIPNIRNRNINILNNHILKISTLTMLSRTIHQCNISLTHTPPITIMDILTRHLNMAPMGINIHL